MAAAPDRAQLAGRIQGFGNVDPPALEEETGKTLAKRAAGRLGDMVGEEVMLTVEDFREKGAVGAVKDAVADAGDILIDGVAGLIGWIRGDPPEEDDGGEAAEDATKALSNGPAGAAYGISQASPTGGINAVWVMPEEADPSTLAELARQQGGGLAPQSSDPRVPKNIQPYQPLPERGALPSSLGPLAGGAPLQLPGGPVIAPYQPMPSGPSGPNGPATNPAPFIPGSGLYHSGVPFPRTGGYNTAGSFGTSAASSAPAGASGAKVLVERIAKGEVIVGTDVARRLVSQCQATKTSGKDFAEMICERIRRLYLGLDGGDPEDADAAMARLLSLADALRSQPSAELITRTLEGIREGVHEELLSLRSSTKYKDDAEPMLQRLGLVDKAPEAVDLLGSVGDASGSAAAATPRQPIEADLLGTEVAAQEADLLGDGNPLEAAAPAKEADLLGGEALVATVTPVRDVDLLGGGDADLLGGAVSGAGAVSTLAIQAGPAAAGDLLGGAVSSSSAAVPAPTGLEGFDTLLAPSAQVSAQPASAASAATSAVTLPLAAGLATAPAAATPAALMGQAAPVLPPAEGAAVTASPSARGALMGTMAQGAVYPEQEPDAFGFVGAEMSRATGCKR